MPRHILLGLALLVACLALYGQVGSHEYVHYDDFAYIVNNARLRSDVAPGAMLQNLFAPALANWNPLTIASFQLEHALHGLAPGPLHLTNAVLHAVASALLYFAMHTLTRAMWPSAFVAAVFALHPLHVESVAWAAERKDVLSAVFWMLTMLAYGWQHAASARPRNRSGPVLVAACLALGLLAKPMLVTLPFVLLLLDLWPLRRLQAESGAIDTALLKRCVIEKLPLFALVAAISAVTFAVQHSVGAVASLDRIPFASRVANAAESYVAYLVASFWPVNLAVFYPHPAAHSAWTVVGCVLALVAISAVVLLQLKSRPYLAVGWLWFLGTLVPVIGLVQVGIQARADRYMYLPQIGLLIMLAWGASELIGRLEKRAPALWVRAGAATAAMLCLAASFALAYAQVATWRDSASLFGHALRVTTDNHIAHTSMGDVLLRAGELEAAAEQYRSALRIKPGWAEARGGLADVLGRLGRDDEAIAAFEDTLRLDPANARAHTNLGLVLVRQQRLDEAQPHLERALELYTALGLLGGRGAAPHLGLAEIARERGDMDAAIAHARAAIRLAPDRARAHVELGMALVSSGRVAEASDHFERAAGMGDHSIDLDAGRGIVAEHQGRSREAVSYYRRALAARPDWVAISNNLAWILATTRDDELWSPSEAIDLAESAVSLEGSPNPGLLDTLAAAYATAGRFEDAVRTQERAIDAAQALGAAALVVELEERLARYRSGHAYLEPPLEASDLDARSR